MAQIRNRYDIENSIEDEKIVLTKKLPNFFNERDGIGPFKGISLSIVFHLLFMLVMITFQIFTNLVLPHLPKPDLPTRDIEFKLVQAESKPPINKKTAIRSDRDSQAGGKHDPTRPISEPKPSQKASKPVAKQTPAAAPKAPKQEPKTVQKQQPKQTPQPKVVQAPTPAKPAPVKAPTAAKPSVKPAGVPAPTAPKIATAPKSPFSVPVAPTNAPTGSTYKPAGTPSSGGGSSSGGSGSSAPAPKFSGSGGGSSSGSSGSSGGTGGKYASRGMGGSGTGGNPGPGNPNGTPGIDAIKQPNWGPYMRDLEQRIKRNWSPPKGDSSKRVVITFTIARDGRLLNHHITKSSGVPLADRAAMSAIELTAPFRPLPPEFKGQSVPIEFTFDYNVLNSVLR